MSSQPTREPIETPCRRCKQPHDPRMTCDDGDSPKARSERDTPYIPRELRSHAPQPTAQAGEACKWCFGTGVNADGNPKNPQPETPCAACHGTGKVPAPPQPKWGEGIMGETPTANPLLAPPQIQTNNSEPVRTAPPTPHRCTTACTHALPHNPSTTESFEEIDEAVNRIVYKLPTPSAGEAEPVSDGAFGIWLMGQEAMSAGIDARKVTVWENQATKRLAENPASPQLPTPELDKLIWIIAMDVTGCNAIDLTPSERVRVTNAAKAIAKAADERFEAANGEDEEVPDDDDKTDQIMVIAQNAHRKEARQRWYEGGSDGK